MILHVKDLSATMVLQMLLCNVHSNYKKELRSCLLECSSFFMKVVIVTVQAGLRISCAERMKSSSCRYPACRQAIPMPKGEEPGW